MLQIPSYSSCLQHTANPQSLEGTSGVAVTVHAKKVETPSVHAHVLCLRVKVGDAKTPRSRKQ